ncbi:MAG TPA: murein biosynthesis integral membrane protein MurJ [Verrucomicrobiae bacterium]|jgi:putative peptidoglycan lipid II flippase|nr:murein biosynthesis integral membrane protein MurJ [Verrucomicrobiae bacterium]
MSKMLKSSGAMAAATMTSRIMGMVREVVYAWFMGAGMVAGAFTLAFQIPNLFRRLLGEGALTAAFIPIFKEKEKTGTPAELWRAANAVISGLIAVASAITVLVMVGITIYLSSGHLDNQPLGPFATNDLRDIKLFAARLEIPHPELAPLAQFLTNHLSEPSRQAILRRNDQTPTLHAAMLQEQNLRLNLMRDLNVIITNGPLYNPALFAKIELSPATKSMLNRHPQGAQLVWLNRLLLEDAYPQELTDSHRETKLMLRLLRIMFPYMLIICVTAVFMGILNARGHFFIPASGALVMNTVMIASVFFLAPHMGRNLNERVFALAIGVLVAGLGQALLQMPWLRKEGFRYHWVSPWRDETVRRVVHQMIPGTIGVAAFQINMLVNQSVAFWVDPSIVAWFNNSVRLMELPQGVFGISLATYLLPTLASLATEKKQEEFRSTLNSGVDHLIFANLPASVFLCILALPIMRLLFEHGRFGPMDSLQAGRALEYLAPGLVAFSLVNIFARAFYALGDTKTPMKISIACLMLNLVLSVIFIFPLRQRGMGLANTLSAVCNITMLYFSLRRRIGPLGLGAQKKIINQLLFSALVAGTVTWALSHWWEGHIGHEGMWHRFGDVFVPMTAGGVIYWGLAAWFKVPPALEIGSLLFQKLRPSRK